MLYIINTLICLLLAGTCIHFGEISGSSLDLFAFSINVFCAGSVAGMGVVMLAERLEARNEPASQEQSRSGMDRQ